MTSGAFSFRIRVEAKRYSLNRATLEGHRLERTGGLTSGFALVPRADPLAGLWELVGGAFLVNSAGPGDSGKCAPRAKMGTNTLARRISQV